MDKVFSARLDEDVHRRIGLLSKTLGKTKKAVIEEAIELYASQVGEAAKGSIFELTSGAWKRNESADETVRLAKEAFRRSFSRHRK